MNKKLLLVTVILYFLTFSTNTMAQSGEWKSGKTKGGKITCKYKISIRDNDEGIEVPLIESTTITVEAITMENCISLMKNVSKHKEFHGDKKSYLIKTISENKWIIYYFTGKTIVTPKSDGVYTMSLTENKLKKTAKFTIKADPTLLKNQGVKRVTYMEEIIKLKDLDNGNVQITMISKVSPAFKVPLWIMKMSFPKICFKVMNDFIKLAHKE